ncbi:hypothetical protein Tco_0327305 [Tanacetum coccineum]
MASSSSYYSFFPGYRQALAAPQPGIPHRLLVRTPGKQAPEQKVPSTPGDPIIKSTSDAGCGMIQQVLQNLTIEPENKI